LKLANTREQHNYFSIASMSSLDIGALDKRANTSWKLGRLRQTAQAVFLPIP